MESFYTTNFSPIERNNLPKKKSLDKSEVGDDSYESIPRPRSSSRNHKVKAKLITKAKKPMKKRSGSKSGEKSPSKASASSN